MSIEYYTPERAELLAAIRNTFAFLNVEFGFVALDESSELYFNPYSVLYRKPPIEVLIEGISYGMGMTIQFRIRDENAVAPRLQFCLSWLTTLRRPDLQEPAFPEKRGQLVQLPKIARELRAVAEDVLRGDLSILPQVEAVIAKAKADAKVADGLDRFRRAETQSREAFRMGKYALVIQALEPLRDLLNKSSRKRLEIAKARVHAPG